MDRKILCLILLVTADGLLTISGINLGFMAEANPFIDSQIKSTPWLMILIKLALVSLGSLILWIRRENRLAIAGMNLLLTAYSLLIFYHFTLCTLYLAGY